VGLDVGETDGIFEGVLLGLFEGDLLGFEVGCSNENDVSIIKTRRVSVCVLCEMTATRIRYPTELRDRLDIYNQTLTSLVGDPVGTSVGFRGD